MARREFSGNAKPTQLDADVTDSATSLTIRNASGWPTGAVGPFVAVINRGKADEEKILVTTRSGTTLESITRGYDDTTAIAHTSTATIEHAASAVDLDEANDHINDATNDHHTQYLLADGTRAMTGPINHDGSTVGFFGVTPTTRPAATDEIKAALALIGLLTDGGASPLNLDGGSLTAGATTVTTLGATGAVDLDSTLNVDGASTLVGKVTASAEVEIDGALNHDGASVGFYGVAPVARPAAITDASTAHALGAVYSDAEVETALNNLGTKINAIIAALESLGLLTT